MTSRWTAETVFNISFSCVIFASISNYRSWNRKFIIFLSFSLCALSFHWGLKALCEEFQDSFTISSVIQLRARLYNDRSAEWKGEQRQVEEKWACFWSLKWLLYSFIPLIFGAPYRQRFLSAIVPWMTSFLLMYIFLSAVMSKIYKSLYSIRLRSFFVYEKRYCYQFSGLVWPDWGKTFYSITDAINTLLLQ